MLLRTDHDWEVGNEGSFFSQLKPSHKRKQGQVPWLCHWNCAHIGEEGASVWGGNAAGGPHSVGTGGTGEAEGYSSVSCARAWGSGFNGTMDMVNAIVLLLVSGSQLCSLATSTAAPREIHHISS